MSIWFFFSNLLSFFNFSFSAQIFDFVFCLLEHKKNVLKYLRIPMLEWLWINLYYLFFLLFSFCDVGFPHMPGIVCCFPKCRNNLRPCMILSFSREDFHLLLPGIWTLAIWHHLNPMLRTDFLGHQGPESWVAVYVKNGFTFSLPPYLSCPKKLWSTT